MQRECDTAYKFIADLFLFQNYKDPELDFDHFGIWNTEPEVSSQLIDAHPKRDLHFRVPWTRELLYLLDQPKRTQKNHLKKGPNRITRSPPSCLGLQSCEDTGMWRLWSHALLLICSTPSKPVAAKVQNTVQVYNYSIAPCWICALSFSPFCKARNIIDQHE